MRSALNALEIINLIKFGIRTIHSSSNNFGLCMPNISIAKSAQTLMYYFNVQSFQPVHFGVCDLFNIYIIAEMVH